MSLTDNERDAFLSQFGSFSPAERDLFGRLCRMWEPTISYQRFAAVASVDPSGYRSPLDTLLEKLRHNHVAVVTSQTIEGQRRPAYIVLTEEDDPIFFAVALEEEYSLIRDEPARPLPTAKVLLQRKLVVPERVVATVREDDFAAMVRDARSDPNVVFKVVSRHGEAIYIPGSSVAAFIGLATHKLRDMLQNNDLLSVLADARSMSLIDLRKRIEGKEARFWFDLCESLLAVKDAIQNLRRYHPDPQLLLAADLLRGFIRGKMSEIEEQKRRAEDRKLDMEAMAEAVKNADDGVMNTTELDRLIEGYKSKYGDDWAGFKTEFEQSYRASGGDRNPAILISVQDGVIHRDRYFEIFSRSLSVAADILKSDYVETMRDYLRGRSATRRPIFTNPDAFEADLAERLPQIAPLLNEMLAIPNVLAECVIRRYRERGGEDWNTDLRNALAQFFVGERIRFRRTSALLGINLVEVYETAFARLPVWRQIFQKLSGRFEDRRKNFARQTRAIGGTTARRAGTAATSKTVVDGPATRNDRAGRRAANRSTTSSSRGSTANRSRVTETGGERSATSGAGPKVEKVRRPYSREETESAWSEFDKTVRKPE